MRISQWNLYFISLIIDQFYPHNFNQEIWTFFIWYYFTVKVSEIFVNNRKWMVGICKLISICISADLQLLGYRGLLIGNCKHYNGNPTKFFRCIMVGTYVFDGSNFFVSTKNQLIEFWRDFWPAMLEWNPLPFKWIRVAVKALHISFFKYSICTWSLWPCSSKFV